MTMQLQVTIPDNFLMSIKEQRGDFINNMLFNHALMLYRKNKLSLGKAAELAGYDKLSFIQKLQSENEAIFDYETELVDEMLDNTQRTLALLNKQK
jgi:predicted HTH domain antitoxin